MKEGVFHIGDQPFYVDEATNFIDKDLAKDFQKILTECRKYNSFAKKTPIS